MQDSEEREIKCGGVTAAMKKKECEVAPPPPSPRVIKIMQDSEGRK